ncbi:ribose-phosphate pyrophosphokinase [Phototrophicus methaneseepsis]|uniref:Ribose-phosphate pyrophosphokinase n=1 Tax=Phototrophicus methaneseepsis TaxID=2710758 RepID=A0A7S8ECZ2_9CHLR|nr:ribose-phosphate diphosphokinase [Phototrophicus methaneseepsis]QPC84693.1 ribose-phosphate pyrophosphokinase [Phototrophicus methaneseepsis]
MNNNVGDHIRLVERSPRGKLIIAGCTPATYLARPIVARLKEELADDGSDRPLPYLENIDFHFSDSEIGVRLDTDVSGCDVFLLQALYDPHDEHSVSENYLALCIAARTFREWGAHKITAMLPYLAYARQDKPTRFQREPTTARLMADLAITSGIDRLVTWHPHYQQIHGFYSGIPVDVLEAQDYYEDLFAVYRGRKDVVLVAPDVGASKFVTHLGHALDLKVAIASKYHPEQEQTEITQIIGDLADKRVAIIVDDMMSSGGTIFAAVQKLVEEYGIAEVLIAVSHNLCTDKAFGRLIELQENYHLQHLYVTNSIPQTDAFHQLPFVTIHDISDTLVKTIKRIHYDRL